ncbi:hypothetical protein RYX45_19480 [Alkalihalophilus pseudofirmus]|uniref:Uncharacterized protein n=1 Tax=Alkalihalophilus pseudofirmus TaxID=79885 RepID=A0AAJ2U5G3_ALKPS|nr:hypothetical protein [Alkalihalophilus pseudofirmus]MDV2887372.1 hypothetical protein [Alkalihalophilus pseudofirmus]
MKKYLGVTVLATALVLSGTPADGFAQGKGNSNKAETKFAELEDGRQAKGMETGVITNVEKNQEVFYEGDQLVFTKADIEIDGPQDTLQWYVDGKPYEFGEALNLDLGENNIKLEAKTTFKNGQKAGLVHSTALYELTITVLPKELPKATSFSSEWNTESGKAVGTVKVEYTITINNVKIGGSTNFNKQERDAKFKEIFNEEYNVKFIVEYLAPPQ